MNTRNPYSPPGAPVAEIAPALAPASKPISIWLLQIICATAAIFWLIGGISGLRLAMHPFAAEIGIVAVLTAAVLRLIVAALLVWTIVAAQRRSQVGRWLGAILTGGAIAIMLFVVVESTPGEGSFATVLGRYVGALLVLATPALLLYFATFSKRARAWYAKAPEIPEPGAPAVEATARPPAPT